MPWAILFWLGLSGRSSQCDCLVGLGWVGNAFALSGRKLHLTFVPRALPWAEGLLPFQGAPSNAIITFPWVLRTTQTTGLKGQKNIAQGNALGKTDNTTYRPERAKALIREYVSFIKINMIEL